MKPGANAMNRLKLCLIFVVTLSAFFFQPIGSTKALPPGFKHERGNAKFVLTSTRVEHWNKEATKGGCIQIDLYVPETFDPFKLCLRLKTPGVKLPGFDRNFKLVIPENSGQKVLSLGDILVRNKAVDGYVAGPGVSFVNGYFSDNAFYGTLVHRHFARDQTIHCSVLPLHQLPDFVEMSRMDEEEQSEFIWRKTVKKFQKVGANAIVACGDMHRTDNHDIPSQFAFKGPPSPTNVNVKDLAQNKVRISGANKVVRIKRQDPGAAPLPPAMAPPSSDVAAPPPPALAPPPPDMRAPPEAEGEVTPKLSKEELKANKTMTKNLGKLLRIDKHGTLYATVCYVIDSGYLERRFNNTPEEATLLLGGFVEITDWVLRSTDWNMDGVPDNIGMRLLEVNIQHLTSQLKEPDEKWGRADGGSFRKRSELFNLVRRVGRTLSDECDIRSGIGEVNVAKYVMHEPGGCTACKHEYLTSFVNPYVEKFSPRGEQLRLMYHQIRLLTFAYVHTKGYCANCSDASVNAKQSPIAGTFENGDADWGACIVEGDIQSRSNIPLNSFRLSVCSRADGMSCLKKIAAKENCLQFEPEESYCGNGLIEGDEECDCGSLATCADQACTCSPRSGRNPCRKLSAVESGLCFTLIRCRDFRFLHETGQGNGSNFLAAFSTFVEGTHFKVGGRRDDDNEGLLDERGGIDKSSGGIAKSSFPLLFIILAMKL